MVDHISKFSNKILTSVLYGIDIADADIFLKWYDIVEEEFSSYITPNKVLNINGNKTLYLTVSRYKLLEAQYSKERLVQQLNGFFGKDKFYEIKFVVK